MTKEEFISQFKSIEKIKKGGQKIVYKAIYPNDSIVALKLIYNANDPRIKQEIEILNNLHISNVPNIICTGYITDEASQDEALYIIEEYIPGQSLRDILNENRTFDLPSLYNIFKSLLLIEIELEKCNLLHRDINPNNIMISNESVIYLIDFGLAKNLNGTTITDTNALNGPFTPGYAPNEQIANKRMEQDVRTDLFQIGVTIYECCVGNNPFADKTDNICDIIYKTTTYSPPTLNITGDTNGQFAQLINMLMAKNPSQRPDSAEAALRYLIAIGKMINLEV